MPVIAAAADLLYGLVMLLFRLVARALVGTIVRSIGDHIPLVGGALSAAANAIADAISAVARAIMGTSVDTVSGAFLTPTLMTGMLFTATVNSVTQLNKAAAHTALAVIPRAEVSVLSTTRSWVDTLSNTVTRDVAILRSQELALSAADVAYTTAVGAEVTAYSTALAARDLAITEAGLAADDAYALALSKAGLAYTASVQAELVAYIQHVEVTLERYTTAEIAQVETYIGTVQHDVIELVDHDVAVVEQEITATRVQVETELLPRIDAVQSEITTLRETCIDDLCANQNERGKQLKNLDGIWSIAALLAYVTAAVAEPQDTARATNDVVGPILSGLMDAVVAVTGPSGSSSGG